MKLKEVPYLLKEKKKEVLGIMLASRNARRTNNGLPPLTPDGEKALKDSIPLMIKADDKTFYGRILQVVNYAKDTLSGIKNFTFVTLPEASAEVRQKLQKQEE